MVSIVSDIQLVLRIALRELRGGLKGFYVFIACIALGVGAIVAVNSITDMFERGISEQGQVLLGGDVELSRVHQRADDKTKDFFKSKGQFSEILTMRGMARKQNDLSQALVEIKAVDSLYPMFGSVKLKDDVKPDLQGELQGVADPILFERLSLKVGDTVLLGKSRIKLVGIIDQEPDRLSSRNAFGPRLIVSLNTLEKTSLLQPGSLLRWRYRLKLSEALDNEKLAVFTKSLKKQYSSKGFRVRDRKNPAPGIQDALSRLSKFLTLVGLTSLLIGGVGIANAVRHFIDSKVQDIATLKSVGAENRYIFWIYISQILAITLFGILAGTLLGVTASYIAGLFFNAILPIEGTGFPEVGTLVMGALFGFLIALLFMILPLRGTRNIRPRVLFRGGEVEGRRISLGDVLIVLAFGALVAFFAIYFAQAELFAFYFCAALVSLFGLFFLYGYLVKVLAKRLPSLRGSSYVIARANVVGPHSLTLSIILSLGLGLSLLVAVSNIDYSLTSQLRSGLPEKAPSHFFLDIKRDQYQSFEKLVAEEFPKSEISYAPMLRGRIIKLAGKKVEDFKAKKNVEWVLRGDRGLSYSDTIPKGAEIVEGEWWGKDYKGPPLVSFEVESARGLGLKIGDEIIVNVLGREISARIGNFRTVKWESLSINFILIFSPNTLAGAPVNMLATLTPKEKNLASENEGAFLQKLSVKYPNITAIRVKDAIDAVAGIYERIILAIRIAGGLTIVAGAIVLAGALISAQKRRIYDSVIFKTLGASRGQILTSHLMEYVILSFLTAILAFILGSVAAWAVLTFLLDLKFYFSIVASLQVILFSVFLVIFFGIIGTWRVLSAKTVPYLRGS